MHGLSIKSPRGGEWDWELVASLYRYDRDDKRQNAAGVDVRTQPVAVELQAGVHRRRSAPRQRTSWLDRLCGLAHREGHPPWANCRSQSARKTASASPSLQNMPHFSSIDIVGAFARWHPGLLLLLIVAFGVCFVLSLTQFATGRGDPIGLLLVGVVGVALLGKGIARKYAKELAQSKAEQDKLNA